MTIGFESVEAAKNHSKARREASADRIRAMAGQMVQLQGDGVLQALLDARNLITTRAKDLIADPNFGSDSHA